jgi:hypothetical protein
MVDKVALGQFRLPVLVFSYVGIITPVPQAPSNTTVFRRASGQNLGTFEQTNVISNLGGGGHCASCSLHFHLLNYLSGFTSWQQQTFPYKTLRHVWLNLTRCVDMDMSYARMVLTVRCKIWRVRRKILRQRTLSHKWRHAAAMRAHNVYVSYNTRPLLCARITCYVTVSVLAWQCSL